MKFNFIKADNNQVKNHEGEVAYKTSAELELYTSVVTASLSNNFYESADDRLKRIIRLIGEVSPHFVAKLAIYTRENMHLRSVPLVLLAELSKVHFGDSLVSKTTSRVIQRADEITELLAYYQLANSREGEKKLNKLSKQIQKGVAVAFNKFDEYQFAKYNRKTEVTFKDALFLTHPKAISSEQQALFDKIVTDDLEVPYTWEVELSKIVQTQFASEEGRKAAVTQKWEELIASNRLGYMALLRNLRNILQAEVGAEAIEKVASRLADPHEVRRSKQLPFRFLAAYNELRGLKLNYLSVIIDALEEAIMSSAANIVGFDLQTRVLIAADVSGSMYTPVGGRSKIRCYDVGLTLSMLLAAKSKNVVTGIFGDRWQEVSLSTRGGILSNVQELNRMEGQVGYSTNAYRVIDAMIAEGRVMDKVLFFTDLQLWDSRAGGSSLKASWTKYKREVAPQAKLYLFDLVGYGNTPLSVERDDVFLLAGWSDKVFDILSAIEAGGNALTEIEQITLTSAAG
ncbi:TROVE domain-containing protein [Fulvivirga sediminis]|uniref:TROVE domain-containing protein n=1 Tax=Fulvivirga sediminis TaxID=2803949 RepID=A0A937FDI6_9BACT|nr:TROVE domain-containing protein [Fulvivirga sediminis]MBL3658774.1 TROVE domain-containing protein [Fulvivirga sediminis]